MSADRFSALNAELAARGARWHPAGKPTEGASVFDVVVPPVALLRDARLDHNIRLLQKYANDHGVQIAPHGKTTMAPEIWRRQLAAGAWGLTAATASQVHLMAALGVERVLLANEVTDPASLQLLCSARDEFNSRIICLVDSVPGVRRMDEHLKTLDSSTGIEVLVELGARGQRTGCRTYSEALTVAWAAQDSDHLELAGIECFEGLFLGEPESQLNEVDVFLGWAASTIERLLQTDIFGSSGEIILSAGGSAYFDRVVEHLHPQQFHSHHTTLVLRSGCYVSHDCAMYEMTSPLGGARGTAERLLPALEVWAQVLSVPEPDLAICGAGKRDYSDDYLPPAPIYRRRNGAIEPAPAEWVVRRLMDHHTFLGGHHANRTQVGDWIAFGINHPCTTFDKWSLLPLVDEDYRITDVVATYFS